MSMSSERTRVLGQTSTSILQKLHDIRIDSIGEYSFVQPGELQFWNCLKLRYPSTIFEQSESNGQTIHYANGSELLPYRISIRWTSFRFIYIGIDRQIEKKGNSIYRKECFDSDISYVVRKRRISRIQWHQERGLRRNIEGVIQDLLVAMDLYGAETYPTKKNHYLHNQSSYRQKVNCVGKLGTRRRCRTRCIRRRNARKASEDLFVWLAYGFGVRALFCQYFRLLSGGRIDESLLVVYQGRYFVFVGELPLSTSPSREQN